MKSFFNKIKEYGAKITLQSVRTKLKFENLTAKEIDYIKNNIGLGGEIIKDLGLNTNTQVFNPSTIDKAIKAWFDYDLTSMYDIDVNMYSNALASGWGSYLEEQIGMQWSVITDAFGTEIGLYHINNETTIFPFNSTAKAFNNQDFHLISKITEKVRLSISS